MTLFIVQHAKKSQLFSLSVCYVWLFNIIVIDIELVTGGIAEYEFEIQNTSVLFLYIETTVNILQGETHG